jgi:hypothetical protein
MWLLIRWYDRAMIKCEHTFLLCPHFLVDPYGATYWRNTLMLVAELNFCCWPVFFPFLVPSWALWAKLTQCPSEGVRQDLAHWLCSVPLGLVMGWSALQWDPGRLSCSLGAPGKEAASFFLCQLPEKRRCLSGCYGWGLNCCSTLVPGRSGPKDGDYIHSQCERIVAKPS